MILTIALSQEVSLQIFIKLQSQVQLDKYYCSLFFGINHPTDGVLMLQFFRFLSRPISRNNEWNFMPSESLDEHRLQ